jgi:hypothetical protein
VVQAIAERAVADLIVVLDADDRLAQGQARGVGATRALQMPRVLAGEEPAVPHDRRQLRRVAVVVLVVPVRVARDHAPDDVMEIVGPDAVEPPASARRVVDHRREVAVILGKHQRAAVRRLVRHCGDLGGDVRRARVEERVRGVEAESVRVILADPMARVLDDEPPDAVRAGAVEVDRGAPRRRMRVTQERRTEEREVRAFGSEMVVDDVDQHGETVAVGGVHERPEIVGPAVGTRRREQRDAVVAPVPAPGELGDGHQLDGGDAEVAKVRQPADRRAERALGRERADVQFVDDGAPRIEAAPVLVRPREGARVDDLGPAVDAVRLKAADGIGERIPAVEAVGVTVAGARVRDDDLPDALCR